MLRCRIRCGALVGILAILGVAGCAHSQNQSLRGPAATGAPTMTIVAPALYTKNSYRGQPDLGLTVAIVQAGNRHGHFDGPTLLRVLAGPNYAAENVRLERTYGKAQMAAFVQTLTFAVNDLQHVFAYNHIAMPAQPRIEPRDGRAIALAIYRDGITTSGKYDCGYMMEHLMTHPVHVVLMRDINNHRAQGAARNANFHTILTRIVLDLKNSMRASLMRRYST